MIEVRSIRKREVAAAIALIVGGTSTPDAQRPDDLDRYYDAVVETRARGGDVLVAVESGEVVGVCQLVIFQHFQHHGGMCAELESVHVRNDRRSEGIGAAMLNYAEHLAELRGCWRIQLTSNVVRKDAHRFYVDNGYSQSHLGFKKLL